MKLLVDMNLSPAWASTLTHRGYEALHWSMVGHAVASDQEILDWARSRGLVVLTHDLDFGAILAATQENTPSVLQLRTQDILSDRAVEEVLTALASYAHELEAGALLSIDESGARVRLLPLRNPEE